jgi:hypothetical protein
MNLSNRYPSTQSIMQFFTYDHLPSHLATVSKESSDLAESMVTQFPDHPELTAGLRKLLEAKDCFVRLAVAVKE